MKNITFRWSSLLSFLYLVYQYLIHNISADHAYFTKFMTVSLFMMVSVLINHHVIFPRLMSGSKLFYFLLVFFFTTALGAFIVMNLSNFYNVGYTYRFDEYLKFFLRESTYQGIFTGLFLCEEIFVIDKQRRRLEREKTLAELSLLKYQVNPHFLFNTLNNIYSSALKEKSPITADSVLKLSHLMRYMLYESENEKVVLNEEIEYLKDFVELQRMRISDEYQLEISMQISGEGFEQTKIAPMILIPFVENAFKHGISLKVDSFIDIKIRLQNSILSLIVINTIRDKSIQSHSDRKNSGVGLDNVRKRLEMIYGGRYELDILQRTNTFHVNLEIQLS